MDALAVFTKAPVAGQVKTRLCPPLSAEEAADLYRCCLLDTVEKARLVDGVSTVVAYAPRRAESFMRALLPSGTGLIPQRGANLGQRMAGALRDLLAEGFGAVAIVGADLPTLPPAELESAFRLLAREETDLVLGPSEDGGYYLIGSRNAYPGLFQGIRWSGQHVLAQTRARARRLGLRVAYLRPWYDVDTRRDLERLSADLAGVPPAVAPRTRRFLLEREPPVVGR